MKDVVFECPYCHISKFSINVLEEMFRQTKSLKFACDCYSCGNTVAAKAYEDLSVETKTMSDLLQDYLKS